MMGRAAAVLLLTGVVAQAAPVPPSPRLSEELLVGSWGWEWGAMVGGKVTFNPDGTYTARHHEAGPVYAGRWWVDRGSVVLIEFRVCPDGFRTGPQRYEFTLGAAFVGATPQGIRVALTR